MTGRWDWAIAVAFVIVAAAVLLALANAVASDRWVVACLLTFIAVPVLVVAFMVWIDWLLK